MAQLFILWRSLHGEIVNISEQKKIFEGYSEDILINLAKDLCVMEYKEHYPQESKIVLSERLQDVENFETKVRSFQLIYGGAADNYRELLISLNVMMLLIDNPRERKSFIVDLWQNIKHVNKELSPKFADDLATAAHYSIKFD